MELTNLTGLEKPATELIIRVSDAVGGIAKPWQIKRVAKAEAEAAKIHALADLEMTEIRARAVKRMILEEEKNQENIESITMKAIPYLPEDAKPENLDEDFIRYFFDKAKMVSNDEMQEVWAKILAGEVNKSGSFSRRTIDIVSQMSRGDAELFTRFCGRVWKEREPFVYNPNDALSYRPYEWGLKFDDLAELESAGLIRLETASRYVEQIADGGNSITYFSCEVLIDFGTNERHIGTGSAILTSAGRQLAPIAGATPNAEYFEQCLWNLIGQGISVSIPISSKEAYPRGPNV